MTTSPHRHQARAGLADAEAALAKGDLCAASEHGWQAASAMVHAAADIRGWTPEDPAEPWATHNLMSRLCKASANREELDALFSAAGELWLNATDGFLHPDVVAFDLADVRKFMDLLETLVGEDAPVRP